MYSKTEDFMVFKKFFQDFYADPLTAFFWRNNYFHNRYVPLMLAKSNHRQWVIIFANHFAPEIFSDIKAIFVCPIIIKSAKPLV